MFRRHVLPIVSYLFFRMWSGTWRVRCIESEGLKRVLAANEPVVFAFWHGDELMVISLVTAYRIATMTSTSSDGELISYTVHKLGGATSRGSSTRGGVRALKGLVRLMAAGYRGSIAVDGPKGPIYRAKPGIFEVSRLAKAKIVPMGAASKSPIIFHKSWNKARLPKPFANVVVWFSEPLMPITREQSPKDPALAKHLEDELSKACQLAANHLP